MQPATAVNKFVYLNSKVARSAARACPCPLRVYKGAFQVCCTCHRTPCRNRVRNAGPVRCTGVARMTRLRGAAAHGTCPRWRSEQRAMFA